MSMPNLPSKKIVGKQEECRGCIGFDEKHTCDGWAEFQIMKAEKDKCHSCAALRVEIEQLTNERDHLNSRRAHLRDTVQWYADGGTDGGSLARSSMKTERVQQMRAETTKGAVRDASCLDAKCEDSDQQCHKPHCDHFVTEKDS